LTAARPGWHCLGAPRLVTSLPVGPYRLEFSLTGFKTSVQTGIVLQVNTNPTINASLALGALSETISVEAQSPLIETRSPGIGMVVENERVQELPLNGRQTLDLIYLTGMAAPSGTLRGARGGQAGAGSPSVCPRPRVRVLRAFKISSRAPISGLRCPVSPLPLAFSSYERLSLVAPSSAPMRRGTCCTRRFPPPGSFSSG
jgi:hypothetical protein